MISAINKGEDLKEFKLEKSPEKYEANLKLAKDKLYACAQVDICICCDVTGSMDQYIDSVKTSLFELTLDFKNSSIVPRFAFLGYRDKSDKNQYEICDFTTDLDKILLFIERVKCSGGGDACEDCVGALLKAIELDWQSKEKYLIWILDAPAHGARYHEASCSDDYPLDDRAEINLEKTISYYSEVKIPLIIFKCNNSVNRMLEIIDQNYKFYNITTTIHEFKGKLVSEIKLKFKQESSHSIKKLHASISVDEKQRQVGHVNSDIRWDTTMVEKRFRFDICDGTLEYISFDGANPGFEIAIEERASAFYNLGLSKMSKGTFRDCYQLYNETGKYIAKITSVPYEASSILKARCDINTVVIGNYFAAEFNKALDTGQIIQFLTSMLFKVDDKDLQHKIFCQNKYFIAEMFMAGKYTKYNNNNGWINEAESTTDEFQLLQAFSHFTFQKSQGYLIIVDLQGTIKENKILLTDPAIHGQGEKFSNHFGRTNCGLRGISEFFLTHVCNKYCKKLKLDTVNLYNDTKSIDNPELYKDITYRLPKIGEAKTVEMKKEIPLNKKIEDLAIYIAKNKILSEDEVRMWLKSFIEYEDLFLYPAKPHKDRKIKVWLKDPSSVGKLIELYKEGIPFNTGKALLKLPKTNEERKFTIPRQDVFFEGNTGRNEGMHKSTGYIEGGKMKRDKFGKPHFSMIIECEKVKNHEVKGFLCAFCKLLDFELIPDKAGRMKVEVWIKDYTKVPEIVNKTNLRFMGKNIKIFVEENVSEPDAGPPHICAVLNEFSPPETEIKEWVSKYFKYRKYSLITKKLSDRLHNTLKIWLVDPESASAVMANYKGKLEFGSFNVSLFLPNANLGYRPRGHMNRARRRRP